VLTADGKLNARGIRYTYQWKEYLISAREIILCAGVFEAPTILERSGVGSKEGLAAANVPFLYDLPGVGENLQDHLNCGLSCETRDDFPTHDPVLRSLQMRKAASLECERSRTGRLLEGGAYSFTFTPLQMLESLLEMQELTEAVKHWVEEESNLSL
jgi:choline dehydrogenase-like flavoprotein